MMLITELMQGGDLGRKLKNDVEIPARQAGTSKAATMHWALPGVAISPFNLAYAFFPSIAVCHVAPGCYANVQARSETSIS